MSLLAGDSSSNDSFGLVTRDQFETLRKIGAAGFDLYLALAERDVRDDEKAEVLELEGLAEKGISYTEPVSLKRLAATTGLSPTTIRKTRKALRRAGLVPGWEDELEIAPSNGSARRLVYRLQRGGPGIASMIPTPALRILRKAAPKNLTARLVYAYVASFTFVDKECWASNETIAGQVGATTVSVQAALKRLEASNLLRRRYKGGGRKLLAVWPRSPLPQAPEPPLAQILVPPPPPLAQTLVPPSPDLGPPLAQILVQGDLGQETSSGDLLEKTARFGARNAEIGPPSLKEKEPDDGRPTTTTTAQTSTETTEAMTTPPQSPTPKTRTSSATPPLDPATRFARQIVPALSDEQALALANHLVSENPKFQRHLAGKNPKDFLAFFPADALAALHGMEEAFA